MLLSLRTEEKKQPQTSVALCLAYDPVSTVYAVANKGIRGREIIP
jgi:hypothetical protein